jgi:hypothetical protein
VNDAETPTLPVDGLADSATDSAALTVTEIEAWAVLPSVSVTVTLIVYVPAELGVQDSADAVDD